MAQRCSVAKRANTKRGATKGTAAAKALPRPKGSKAASRLPSLETVARESRRRNWEALKELADR